MSDTELPGGVLEDLLLLEKLGNEVGEIPEATLAAAVRLTQWVAGGTLADSTERVTAILSGLASSAVAQNLVISTMAARLCGLSRDLRKFKERLIVRGKRG